MALDFSNENYVRLYVRNTLTWRKLGFEGRSIFPQALRAADRAGIIAIGNDDPAEALAELIEAPVDFVRLALTRMLDLDVVRHIGTELVFPRYIEANETGRSDVVRQRENRLKRRDKVIAAAQQLPLPSQTQLDCDNNDPNDSDNIPDCHNPLSIVGEVKEDLNSSSEISEQPACQVVDLGRDAATACATGYRWLDEWRGGGGRAPSLEANKRLYTEIGRKPPSERQRVAKHLSETEWIRADKRRAHPKHICSHWEDYVAGPRNFGTKPGGAKRYAGTGPTNAPADYIEDKESGQCF